MDEIEELQKNVQANLLKYLDDHEILHLGGTKPKTVDSKIIAVTNQDLDSLVVQGKFRKDLFFRLNAFTIKIPPLCSRYDDIFELVNYFLKKYNKEYKLNRRISIKGMKKLQTYLFPGNVRELKNIIRKAIVLSEANVLDDILLSIIGEEKSDLVKYSLPSANNQKPLKLATHLADVEKTILDETLRHYKSTRKAAKSLGISQSSVMRKIKKYGLG